MEFNFEYKNKKIKLDVDECKSFFSRGMGLMFKKNSKPLIFLFKSKKKEKIHSFFCVPFVAVWFDDNRVVDVKIVKPWKLSIVPKKDANILLEIPINSRFFSFFADERKV